MSCVAFAGLAALVLVAVPVAGAAIPIEGTYSGATAAGEPISMRVSVNVKPKRQADGTREKVRRVLVKAVMSAVPISCNSGSARSEAISFPGPLQVKGDGRFSRTGVGTGPAGKVTTKVAARFTGPRVASGTFTYRGGFFGEFCTGAVAWTATR
jgi:hypothetical protein